MIDLENNYLNIGCDFIDAEGNRTTSIQLVKKNGGAIADATYDNEKLIKCLTIDSVDKTSFLHEAGELLNNSIPVTFRKQNLSVDILQGIFYSLDINCTKD